MNVIALDIGGTKISSAIFDDAGKILTKNFTLIEQRKGAEVGDLIEVQIKKLLQEAKKKRKKISAIGISIPGIYWRKKGTVWAPNIAGWEDYPLFKQLKKVLKGENIKIKIDSDRSCYILGEVWKGSAKGCKNAIFVAVGTGIGLGILADGKILRGASDIAGATGWMALNRPFKHDYISCGCFEYHASGNGIAKVAREYLKKDKIYFGLLKNKNPDEITSEDIFEAYERSDAIAKRILNEAIEFWGMAVANYVSLFNPEKIIFGGGVFGPALKFLDDIMAEARKWAQPISINQVELVGSKLGGDAGLYGAGYLALKNF